MGHRRTWLALLLMVLPLAAPRAQSLATLLPQALPGFGIAPMLTVRSRAEAANAAEPMHAGAFLVSPGLEQSLGYDDNVFSSAARRGSWMLGTAPSLRLSSDWSRDAFGLVVSARDTRYPEQPRQNRTDANAALGGALDFGHDRLTLGFAHLSAHDSRSALDAIPADRPIRYELDEAGVSYATGFGALTLTPELTAARWQYDGTTIGGAPVSQSYRDRLLLRAGTTLRYEFAPLRNLVLVTRALSQHYTAAARPSPDSNGLQMLGGIDYDDDTVWHYRLLVGAETRQFAAAAYRPHRGVIAEGEIVWNPSGMTTLHGTITRGVEDAAQEGVSGYTFTEGKLGIDHELARDWLISSGAALRQAQFLQVGGQQSGHGFGLGLTWLVQRGARVSATYDFSAVRGGSAVLNTATPYARDLAVLTLKLGL